MQITYGNIIFSLQRAGGISIFWSELIKRMLLTESKFNFYELPNENIFREELSIEVMRESALPLKFLWYIFSEKNFQTNLYFTAVTIV